MLIFPDLFSTHPVSAAISTRHGGISPAPYNSLNLDFRGDDPAPNREQNRSLFCKALGYGIHQLAGAVQVHGCEILHVTQPGHFEGYDALITDVPGILIGVSVADCTPILIYDAEHRAVAAIHAGWKGTAGRIVERTLLRMNAQWGTEGYSCYAWIGPCISIKHFEVGDEVAEQFEDDLKIWNLQSGKYHIDLKKANATQLEAFGIPSGQIEIAPFCTVSDNKDFFSWRAEKGVTGRMLAAIGIPP